MKKTIAIAVLACFGVWSEVSSEVLANEVVAADTVATTAEQKKEAVKSGLQPGDKTFAFHVQDVTGPRAGKTLCYACAFGKHSVINIQTTKLDNELLSLLKALDPLVASPSKIKGDSKHAFVVFLTEDPGVAEKELAAVAKKLGLKNIPLTIYDDFAGPKPYKLSKHAELTVMMWDKNKVTANHAFSAGGMSKDDVRAVLASAKKHLKGK